MDIDKDRIVTVTSVLEQAKCRSALKCKFFNCSLHITDTQMRPCCPNWSIPKDCAFHVDCQGDFITNLQQFFQMRENEFQALARCGSTFCGRCSASPQYQISNLGTNGGAPAPPDEITHVEFATSNAGRVKCNFRCIYCRSHDAFERNRQTNAPDKRILEMFTAICGFSPKLATVYMDYGEISVYDTCDEIFRLWQAKKLGGLIYTNALVFRQSIFDTLRQEKTVLYISLDAGTRETFKKVKGGIDAWERVTGNIRRYSKAANRCIRLKYILLDNVNINDADFLGFIDFACEIDAMVEVAFDFRSPQGLYSDAALTASKKLSDLAKHRKLRLAETDVAP